MFAVEMPDEPDDRSVVLDRTALAWQRRVGKWFATARGFEPTTWEYLVVHYGPLSPLVHETERAEPPAQTDAAGGSSEVLQVFVDPEGLARIVKRGDRGLDRR